MDPNRSDNNAATAANNQQQPHNVHLHMHHVCNCPNVYSGYFPAAAVGYRTQIQPMVSYPPVPPVPRPYLQHYQYTQFNVGNQYSLPITHVATAAASAPVFAAGGGAASAGDIFAGVKDRRDRGTGSQEGNSDGERNNETATMNGGYDFGQVTPPSSELLMNPLQESTENTTPENFVRFLERSCLTAEQIAHRNRNRPCFRNIQNLCIRTRSEILKPCTTISNIHSQGIPWATKDFIYAFVRLTNCWHILKGYWENRDGSSLGKIEKELTPEFRACYVRWEKETIELAAQLTRVFYNLDTNLLSPQATKQPQAQPAPVVVTPTPDIQVGNRKVTTATGVVQNNNIINIGDTNLSTSTLTGMSIPTNNAAKNVRGIIHLPSSPAVTETVDQGNQTYSGDFCITGVGGGKEEGFDSEEERRVYMKPGSYCVPKKEGNDGSGGTAPSPRAIEFLETAQNVNKIQGTTTATTSTSNERYWSNNNLGTGCGGIKRGGNGTDGKMSHDINMDNDFELNLSSHLNVHEWLLTSNFSDFGGEPSPVSTSTVPHEPQLPRSGVPFYDAQNLYNVPATTTATRGAATMLGGGINDSASAASKPAPVGSGAVVTLLQRTNKASNVNGGTNIIGHVVQDIPIKCYAKPSKLNVSSPYEAGANGITDSGLMLLQNLLLELKKYDILEGLDNIDKDIYQPVIDIDMIMMKLKNEGYMYINEVVRDLRYLINYYNGFAENFKNIDNKKKELVTFITDMFSLKLRAFLQDTFPEYDFNDIKGDVLQAVGPLKLAKFPANNEDPFI